LAITLGQLGRVDDAIAQYQEALRIYPDSGWTRNLFGMELIKTGRIREAVDQFRDAIRLDPRNTWPHYNLAQALSQSGTNRKRSINCTKWFRSTQTTSPPNICLHNTSSMRADWKRRSLHGRRQ
jgi:tetratricopeptide (TPR) repeat protein